MDEHDVVAAKRVRKRADWAFIVYVLVLALPFVLVALVSTREIGIWLRTGMCPAGPMDRPATGCGPLDFFFIVFLGGWAAFLVVPMLAGWWGIATLVFKLVRRAQSRR